MKRVLLLVFVSAIATASQSSAEDRIPAKIIDLSNWKLTLPVTSREDGYADELRPPELVQFSEPAHFFVRDQSIVFRAHCGGATTKGSRYPRCELRELDHRSKYAAWSTRDSIRHTMTLRFAITKTPAKKRHVVCAQIHDEQNDLLMVRLEGTKLFIERKPESDVMLTKDYELGQFVNMRIEAVDGRLKAWYEDDLKLDWEVSRNGCYFKAGCYTQSNAEKGDQADAYGEVMISQLKVTHE